MGSTARPGRFLHRWHRRGAAPRRERAAPSEVILLVLVLLIFTRLHAAAGTDVASAFSNALALQSVEHTLHLDIEPATNLWLVQHDALIGPAVLVYRLYYVVLIGVLIWIFLAHADVYLHVRRVFVAMTGLALVVFWVLPMAPPRFALAGVIDVIAEHDLFGSQSSAEMSSGANHFSAMPSLHVGWSAWCAYAAWSALRAAHPRAAWLAWVLPLVMVVVVLATGNHYVLDVVGSAVLLAASIAIATGWGHLAERRARTVSHR